MIKQLTILQCYLRVTMTAVTFTDTIKDILETNNYLHKMKHSSLKTCHCCLFNFIYINNNDKLNVVKKRKI